MSVCKWSFMKIDYSQGWPESIVKKNLFVWQQWKLPDLDRLDEGQGGFSEECVCQ